MRLDSLLLLSTSVFLCAPYKILVYNPKFAFAHCNFMGTVADSLVEAGHDVTVLVNCIDTALTANCSSLAKVISVEAHPVVAANMKRQNEEEFCRAVWRISHRSPLMHLALASTFESVLLPQCEHLLQQKELFESLKNEHFDVGISESLDMCGLGLFHALGIKATVSGSSLALLEGTSIAIGAPLLPSYVPASMSCVGDNMSLFERIENFISVLGTLYLAKTIETRQTQIFRKHFTEDFPDMAVLIARTQLTFTNSLPHLDFVRPTFHKILDLGGLTLKNPSKLSQEWLDILAKRERSVLISFGSVAKSRQMPEEYKTTMIKVIQKFPNVTFIWKHESPIDKRLLEIGNIETVPWIPQNDLLYHARVAAFVTHGGLNSVVEAARHAKPMLVVPMFADHGRMASIVEKRGLGVSIHKTSLADEKTLMEAIHTVLYDQSIRRRCESTAEMLNASRHDPHKLLAEHISLLARFGELPGLQPVSVDLNIFVYYSLDVITVLLIFLIFVLFIVYKTARTIISSVLDSITRKAKSE